MIRRRASRLALFLGLLALGACALPSAPSASTDGDGSSTTPTDSTKRGGYIVVNG